MTKRTLSFILLFSVPLLFCRSSEAQNIIMPGGAVPAGPVPQIVLPGQGMGTQGAISAQMMQFLSKSPIEGLQNLQNLAALSNDNIPQMRREGMSAKLALQLLTNPDIATGDQGSALLKQVSQSLGADTAKAIQSVASRLNTLAQKDDSLGNTIRDIRSSLSTEDGQSSDEDLTQSLAALDELFSGSDSKQTDIPDSQAVVLPDKPILPVVKRGNQMVLVQSDGTEVPLLLVNPPNPAYAGRTDILNLPIFTFGETAIAPKPGVRVEWTVDQREWSPASLSMSALPKNNPAAEKAGLIARHQGTVLTAPHRTRFGTEILTVATDDGKIVKVDKSRVRGVRSLLEEGLYFWDGEFQVQWTEPPSGFRSVPAFSDAKLSMVPSVTKPTSVKRRGTVIGDYHTFWGTHMFSVRVDDGLPTGGSQYINIKASKVRVLNLGGPNNWVALTLAAEQNHAAFMARLEKTWNTPVDRNVQKTAPVTVLATAVNQGPKKSDIAAGTGKAAPTATVFPKTDDRVEWITDSRPWPTASLSEYVLKDNPAAERMGLIKRHKGVVLGSYRTWRGTVKLFVKTDDKRVVRIKASRVQVLDEETTPWSLWTNEKWRNARVEWTVDQRQWSPASLSMSALPNNPAAEKAGLIARYAGVVVDSYRTAFGTEMLTVVTADGKIVKVRASRAKVASEPTQDAQEVQVKWTEPAPGFKSVPAFSDYRLSMVPSVTQPAPVGRNGVIRGSYQTLFGIQMLIVERSDGPIVTVKASQVQVLNEDKSDDESEVVLSRPIDAAVGIVNLTDSSAVLRRAVSPLSRMYADIKMRSANVQIDDGKAARWSLSFWARPRGFFKLLSPHNHLRVTVDQDGVDVKLESETRRGELDGLSVSDLQDLISIDEALSKIKIYYPDLRIEEVNLDTVEKDWFEPGDIDGGDTHYETVLVYAFKGRPKNNKNVEIVQPIFANKMKDVVDLGVREVKGQTLITNAPGEATAWATLTLYADMQDFEAATAQEPLREILRLRLQDFMQLYGVEWVSPEVDTLDIPYQGVDTSPFRTFCYRIRLPVRELRRLAEDGYASGFKAWVKFDYVEQASQPDA